MLSNKGSIRFSRFGLLILLIALGTILLVTVTILAAPGDLDTTFAGDGDTDTDFFSAHDVSNAVAIQTDGKILVAGYALNGSNYNFAVARYNSDGTLDTTFDGDGRVTTAIGVDNSGGYAVTVQPDGKILVAGVARGSTGNWDFALIRYLEDGSLDTSFDGDGYVLTSLFSLTDRVHSVIVQPDGKIIVGGYAINGINGRDFALVRYNSDGSLDTTFSNDGRVITFMSNDDDYGYSLALQPDGKILLAGSIGEYTDFALVRYNSDGTLDTTFDGDGRVITDVENDGDSGQSVLIQPDGKIIVGGYAFTVSDFDFSLIRYNSDGSLDTTFDTDGKVTTDLGGWDRIFSINRQPDGKIVAVGYTGVSGNWDLAIARYHSDGSLDTSFGSNGLVITDLSGANWNNRAASALQPDGKIVAVRSVTQNFGIARYLADNNPPLAGDDNYATDEDTAFITGNVLDNDSDPDGDTLTISSTITTTTTGLVTNYGDGTFGYDPDNQFEFLAAGEIVSDTFAYTIADSQGLTSSARVTITITGVNDAPAAAPDMADTAEDTSIHIAVLQNDSDPDASDTLTITAVTSATNGTAVIDGQTILYTPQPNFYGSDGFSYTIQDGHDAQDSASVTINVMPVNDPPIAIDDTATGKANTDIIVEVLTNDSDPVEGSPLTISAVAPPLSGTAVISGAVIIYSPAAGFVGTDQFNYTISDGEDTAVATITVIVTPYKKYLPLLLHH